MEENPEIRQRKRDMRRAIKERMADMSPEEAEKSSRDITRQVLNSALFRQARSLFVYISIGKEPETGELIRQALETGKAVYVPRCERPPRMEAARITGMEDLRPGRMGIPEPPAGGETAEDMDLAIVPCVSAGRDGRRLGHGGGYYDAFLRGKGAMRLCLCHERIREEGLPATAEDERMDWIATGEGLFPCERQA